MKITSERKATLCAVLLTFVLTVIATLIVANFSSNVSDVKRAIPRLYSVDDPQFRLTMGTLLGPGIVDGNHVTALINGDQIFPAMLRDIRNAKRTIEFETYIYWSGGIGDAFADALADRARAGVKVHVLVDWVGSQRMDKQQIDKMVKAGVAFRQYRPLRWYTLDRMNNRTHRKLLVIDGRVGYTGGVGIAPEWTGHAQDAAHWRDSHFRIEGPVVGQMQAVAIDNWIKATGEVLHGDAYFPDIPRVGGTSAQVFSSEATGGSNVALMYMLAITAAQHSIYIANSYFVPDEAMRDTLLAALRRGVAVHVMVPGPHMDVETVRLASRADWGPLLAAGAKIYEYQPTMYHCKVMVVDGSFVSVGSTNFDARSFRLNDEANVNVFDGNLAHSQISAFEADVQHARRVTFDEWQNRPLREKMIERLFAWFGPLL
ncbi:cardiolipin synthase [Chitinasiproducens palmae]|uniref:Cardiolipin synthase n=1 Tax=Chitinasiproducens palmae TaxID=1770053 RepID=A0A1H2PTU5_9BURK|nr:cardiolipin synthase [Chitinasiproducens palmae]SDV50168.1 cardiolipin synthase [Chitinasiproducens palmae]